GEPLGALRLRWLLADRHLSDPLTAGRRWTDAKRLTWLLGVDKRNRRSRSRGGPVGGGRRFAYHGEREGTMNGRDDLYPPGPVGGAGRSDDAYPWVQAQPLARVRQLARLRGPLRRADHVLRMVGVSPAARRAQWWRRHRRRAARHPAAALLLLPRGRALRRQRTERPDAPRGARGGRARSLRVRSPHRRRHRRAAPAPGVPVRAGER